MAFSDRGSVKNVKDINDTKDKHERDGCVPPVLFVLDVP
jgi:hypothetical protein